MSSKMFLLGRFLKLADLLHRNYCIIERNNETLKKHSKPLPGELMGSAVYLMAFQKPGSAFVQLAGKMKIYLDWANANPGSQNDLIVKLLEKTSTEMCGDGYKFPEKPTIGEKAELIFGYMSELPYYGDKISHNTMDQTESQEEAES